MYRIDIYPILPQMTYERFNQWGRCVWFDVKDGRRA